MPVSHKTVRLEALGIGINLEFKVIICFNCSLALEYTSVERHIKDHNSLIRVPVGLGDTLKMQFDLVRFQNVVYPPHLIPPIFGLPVLLEPRLFCGACQCGSSTLLSLRGHQSNGSRCYRALDDRSYYFAYAQELTTGRHQRYFPVDISGLKRRDAPQVDYAQVFESTLPPAPDYSKLPMQTAEDELNLNQFAYREGWTKYLGENTPTDIIEACRSPENDGAWACPFP